MTSRQQPLPYVLYHSPCLDGFGAAYAAWRHFGNAARYVPLNYTDKLPDLREGAAVYMLDLSFKREVMLELAAKHPHITVIDHHKTAEAELKGIESESPNITVHFDMEHSGAFLAWYWFHENVYDKNDPKRLPNLIRNIEDRDLWRHALPNTKAVTMALATYEQDFEIWHGLMTEELSYRHLVNEGRALLRQQEVQIEALSKEVRAAIIGNYVVPAVNAPYFLASEMGHHLVRKYPHAPFSAVYRDAGNGRRDWSLRSEDSREDVSLVAAALGGGGHRNAAGCSEPWGSERITFVVNAAGEGLSYEDYLRFKGRRVAE